MRRRAIVGVLAVLVVAAVACGSSGDDGVAPATEAPTTSTTTDTATTAPTVELARLRAGPAVEIDVYHRSGVTEGELVDDPNNDLVFLESPSGNISCSWGPEKEAGVYCDLGTRDEPLPEEPADGCALSTWSDTSIRFDENGLQDGLCRSGVRPFTDATVLAYGDMLRFGDYGCISEEVGVTCAHLTTGRAMRVARQDVSTFVLR